MLPKDPRIFVATGPVDMRRGFDGLAALAKEHVGSSVRESSALFVFFNRSIDRLKVLWWDHNGYCVLAKRLERGRFRAPAPLHVSDTHVTIDRRELELIIAGTTLTKRQLHVRP
jgi:transposase